MTKLITDTSGDQGNPSKMPRSECVECKYGGRDPIRDSYILQFAANINMSKLSNHMHLFHNAGTRNQH